VIPLQVLIVGLILFTGWCSTEAAASVEEDFERIRKSLVKIYTKNNPPDLSSPWQSRGIKSTSGSGVIITGNRILTNAHVVANRVNVEVKREGSTKRYTAQVVHVGHECDLAVLAVDDFTFFEGAMPMKLGETPLIRDSVSVYGFPLGGETVSVTQGIVSRIEVSRYAHSGRSLLLVQIDAAINPGNSGGPVVSNGVLVGVAAQSIRSADNVGYMIPASIIRHFLVDVKDEQFDGFPSMGVVYQSIENDGLRGALGLLDDETGVLITGVNNGSSADGVLNAGDVLLEMDGIPIAEDLSVPWRENNRVQFSYLVHEKQVGDVMSLRVLSNGDRKELEVVLKNTDFLIPRPHYDVKPSFFILGGLVFQPLTMDYFRLFKHAPPDFSYYVGYRNLRSGERRQIVLLSKVLASPLTRGYHGWRNRIVARVQDQVPRDLPDLVRIIEESSGPWLKVETESGKTLILSLEEARSWTDRILKMYGIGRDRSEDLVRDPSVISNQYSVGNAQSSRATEESVAIPASRDCFGRCAPLDCRVGLSL
ncbi:trypsin-like serine protease, partial [bacterium]